MDADANSCVLDLLLAGLDSLVLPREHQLLSFPYFVKKHSVALFCVICALF